MFLLNVYIKIDCLLTQESIAYSYMCTPLDKKYSMSRICTCVYTQTHTDIWGQCFCRCFLVISLLLFFVAFSVSIIAWCSFLRISSTTASSNIGYSKQALHSISLHDPLFVAISKFKYGTRLEIQHTQYTITSQCVPVHTTIHDTRSAVCEVCLKNKAFSTLFSPFSLANNYTISYTLTRPRAQRPHRFFLLLCCREVCKFTHSKMRIRKWMNMNSKAEYIGLLIRRFLC